VCSFIIGLVQGN